MLLAAVLAITYSLPATAFNMHSTPGWVTASKTAGRVQLLDAANQSQAAKIQRDDYTVSQVQELAPGAYANTAPTFVNQAGASVQWPFLVGVPISDGFGARTAPCAGCSTFHKGLDMTPGVNTPVQAIATGVVREASSYDNGGLGVYAVVEHTIDGQVVTSTYAHMAEGSLLVGVGDRVSVGQQIGNVGNTGQSTGPHLHLEITVGGSFVDPYVWLQEKVR